MKRTLLFFALAATSLAQQSPAVPSALLFCGMDEVFVLDVPAAEKGDVAKLWSWRAKGRDELPEALRSRFGTTDDCKPVEGGRKVLISSSGGACALVEKASGRVLWYAAVPNAHSLEMLPRDRVVVASSTAATGNRLIVYDLAHSDQPVWETALRSAHGVVWDEQRQRLWALGFDELRCYALADWETGNPSLKQDATYKLPGDDGHDLLAVPQSRDLIVTTHARVYLFDRETREFRLHPELGGKPDVKCVGVNPTTGRTFYLQGDGDAWWTGTLRFLSPASEVHLPKERLYKARWLPATE